MTLLPDDRDEILARVSIAALLEQLGGPPRHRSWRCPSPNHAQTGKTPPVSIDEAAGLWHCHGCGAGGSAIDALVAHGLTLAETFTRLREATELERRPETTAPTRRAPVAEPAPPPNAAEILAAWTAARGWSPDVVAAFGLSVVRDGYGKARVRFPFRRGGVTIWHQDRAVGPADRMKQPAEEVGPLKVEHDHQAGVSTVTHGFDVLRFLTLRSGGATATDVARAWFEKEKPTDAERAKGKRACEGLVARGLAKVANPASEGGHGGTVAALYVALDSGHEEAT